MKCSNYLELSPNIRGLELKCNDARREIVLWFAQMIKTT